MSVIERSFVDSPFGQLHVRQTFGSGRPLVLLHMLPQSSRMFVPLMQRLGQERRIIAPDLPGYGESDGPAAPIEVADYARCVWHALDALQSAAIKPPYDIFGVHGGAKLSVELTLQRPADVGQLILSSLAHIKGEEEVRLGKTFTSPPLDKQGTRFQELWQMLGEHTMPDISLEEAAQCFAEMLRAGEKYTWANNALLRYNKGFDQKLAQLQHHVDLINPGDSLFQQTKATRHTLRHATYHERPDWGLMFAISHADEVADLLTAIASRETGMEKAGVV